MKAVGRRSLLAVCLLLGACQSSDEPGSLQLGLFTSQVKLTSPDPASYDELGLAVAIDGDTAVVGELFDDSKGNNAGAAHVFVRQPSGAWAHQAKLTAADGAADDRFGRGVAISGETVIVGSSRDDDGGADAGAAYVFVRSGTSWSQQQKLTASDAKDGAFFGWSVAVDGNVAVIGAYGDGANKAKAETGAAYAFVRSGTSWSEEQKLTASDGAPGDRFGWALDLDGGTAAIGAYLDDTSALGTGSVYIFNRGTGVWSETQKLVASDAAAGDDMGFDVSINAGTVVAGAYQAEAGSLQDVGAAYVFVKSGSSWIEQQKLSPSDGAALDWYGFSVAVEGDQALVGSLFEDTKAQNAGTVYVWSRSGTVWSQQQKLLAADGAATDWFGYSLGLSNGRAIVGAGLDDWGGYTDAGAAYIFAPGSVTPDSAVPDQTVDTVVPDQTVDTFSPDLTVDTLAPDQTVDTVAPPDQGVPSVDQATPAPDQGTPPDLGTPAPDQGAPAPDQGAPSADQAVPSPDQGTAAVDQGTPAVDQAVAMLDQGPPTPDRGTPDRGTPSPDATPTDTAVAEGGGDTGGGVLDSGPDLPTAGDKAPQEKDSGCDCRVGASRPGAPPLLLLVLGLLVPLARRRRRR